MLPNNWSPQPSTAKPNLVLQQIPRTKDPTQKYRTEERQEQRIMGRICSQFQKTSIPFCTIMCVSKISKFTLLYDEDYFRSHRFEILISFDAFDLMFNVLICEDNG